jgi:hypothetical protein
MLDLPRYLQGVAEILLLAGFAWLGGSTVRQKLLPRFSGPPAWLATSVIGLALLIWTAEILGSFGWFDAGAYLAAVAVVGLGLRFGLGGGLGCPSRLLGFSPGEPAAGRRRGWGEKEDAAAREGHPNPPSRGRSRTATAQAATLIALVIAAAAVVHFGVDTRNKLLTGMTGFDSTWYHGPFAAGFLQSGDTWGLHFIAPQFLAWLYPANAELFHAAGMLAFGRDPLSPLLNLGWFVGCLLALWCVGRPFRVAPWSLALGAIALSVPALSDQAGEARNDIVGIFFLLAAVAIALNGAAGFGSEAGPSRGNLSRGRPFDRIPGEKSTTVEVLAMSALAAGLAAGTKLNFLLPAAVLVAGLAVMAPRGWRWRALWVSALAALAGGGYWYLRNLVHTGNPLPWFDQLGPISLPAPDQALGGREGHSVLGYLTDGSVWSEWFLPGLHHGLTILWPLLAGIALAGLALCLERGTSPALRVAALAGFAAAFAWLVAPTSASGPEGMPRGFESGLRYLAPALVLGLALLPTAPPVRAGLGRLAARSTFEPHSDSNVDRTPRWVRPALALVVVIAIVVGYPVQRHYLRDRYANPIFAAPGLNAAFKWANSISNARIATTSTRQYPLYGTDLSNRVQYVGVRKPHGGFVAPTTCRQWRRLLNAGHYDYVVATRDRIEPGKPPYPRTAAWTAGPWAETVLARPPTKVYKLTAPLDPSACP